jgi:hypothetical protein
VEVVPLIVTEQRTVNSRSRVFPERLLQVFIKVRTNNTVKPVLSGTWV